MVVMDDPALVASFCFYHITQSVRPDKRNNSKDHKPLNIRFYNNIGLILANDNQVIEIKINQLGIYRFL